MWSSTSSAMRPFTAPRTEATSCRISAQPRSASSARSTASTWPRMRRTRLSSFVFPRIVWAMRIPPIPWHRGVYYRDRRSPHCDADEPTDDEREARGREPECELTEAGTPDGASGQHGDRGPDAEERERADGRTEVGRASW